jgi:Predicted hydrolases or acyltransferases (alpha/beta hydrolase superfamily)
LFLCAACSPRKSTTLAPEQNLPSYEIIGQGQQPLVFIHCWGCNKNYWKNQIEPLSKKYRLVLIDLPGHGKSFDVALPEWSVKSLAQSIETLIRKLGLKDVILVGSSMGGPIALQVAGDMPEAVKGIVCVDTLQNAEAKMPKEILEKAASQMEVDYAKTVREFMPMLFPDNPDPKILDWVNAEAVTSNPKATIPLMRNLADVDTVALMKAAKVPIRCVNSKPYKPTALPTAVEVNKKYADFDAIEMEGVGHFPMLERPEEFNSKFQQALDAITLASANPASR